MANGDEEERDSRRKSDRRNGNSGGFSFTLPPIKLPDAAFPSDLQVEMPPPGHRWASEVRPRTVLVAAVLVDLVDAALLFAVGTPLLSGFRVAVWTVVALVLVGLPGLVYAWEGVAVLAGVGWLSAFPSATALALARLLR